MSPMSAFRFASRAFARKLLVACAILALAVTSSAQKAAKSNGNDGDEAGQTAAVDKSTGKLRAPTREEMQELTAGLEASQSTEGLKVTMLEDGTGMIDLDGRFENHLVAKKNADGSISTTCAATPKEIVSFLSTLKAPKDDHAKAKPQVTQTAPALEEK